MQAIYFVEPMYVDEFCGRDGFRYFCDKVEQTVARLDSTIRSHGQRVPQRVYVSPPEIVPGHGCYLLVRADVEPELDTPEGEV